MQLYCAYLVGTAAAFPGRKDMRCGQNGRTNICSLGLFAGQGFVPAERAWQNPWLHLIFCNPDGRQTATLFLIACLCMSFSRTFVHNGWCMGAILSCDNWSILKGKNVAAPSSLRNGLTSTSEDDWEDKRSNVWWENWHLKQCSGQRTGPCLK